MVYDGGTDMPTQDEWPWPDPFGVWAWEPPLCEQAARDAVIRVIKATEDGVVLTAEVGKWMSRVRRAFLPGFIAEADAPACAMAQVAEALRLAGLEDARWGWTWCAAAFGHRAAQTQIAARLIAEERHQVSEKESRRIAGEWLACDGRKAWERSGAPSLLGTVSNKNLEGMMNKAASGLRRRGPGDRHELRTERAVHRSELRTERALHRHELGAERAGHPPPAAAGDIPFPEVGGDLELHERWLLEDAEDSRLAGTEPDRRAVSGDGQPASPRPQRVSLSSFNRMPDVDDAPGIGDDEEVSPAPAGGRDVFEASLDAVVSASAAGETAGRPTGNALTALRSLFTRTGGDLRALRRAYAVWAADAKPAASH